MEMLNTDHRMIRIKLLFAFCLSLLALTQSRAQHVALKTNLLYGGYTQTPNLSLEIGLGRRSTLNVGGGYNWFNLAGSETDNKKQVHWLGQLEYRYWTCSKFGGHFVGVHILGSQFNIGVHALPLLLGRGSEAYRYEGWAAGAGLSYGYSFYLSNRWSVELNIGAGYARLDYGKYACAKCGKKVVTEHRNYFGPSQAGISLIYIIK